MIQYPHPPTAIKVRKKRKRENKQEKKQANCVKFSCFLEVSVLSVAEAYNWSILNAHGKIYLFLRCHHDWRFRKPEISNERKYDFTPFRHSFNDSSLGSLQHFFRLSTNRIYNRFVIIDGTDRQHGKNRYYNC